MDATTYKLWLQIQGKTEGRIYLGDFTSFGRMMEWRDVREFSDVCVDPESGTVTRPGGISLLPPVILN